MRVVLGNGILELLWRKNECLLELDDLHTSSQFNLYKLGKPWSHSFGLFDKSRSYHLPFS